LKKQGRFRFVILHVAPDGHPSVPAGQTGPVQMTLNQFMFMRSAVGSRRASLHVAEIKMLLVSKDV
jgi:hypothetical protein